MSLFKKIALLLLAVMMVTTGVIVQDGSAAKEIELPAAPTEGAPSKDLSNGQANKFYDNTIQATEYLMRSQSSIAKASSSQVTVSGSTRAYSSVNTIGIDLYLQRWDESKGKWIEIGYIGEFKNINSSIVTAEKKTNIVSGYYYRTRAYHWINKGGLIESDNTYSTYILVN
ncbi:hypothetical protein BEP19_00525 [Ammoniphilus oxalaticus]|uniref:Uncharacterized protein n=1 Tax=Ammoniphilus oxalaticus TaxID=66863 RepID=A0A419SRP4_9BACL|nr:DUF6147 family protein [Ammoniphilus oxalaticus]RKD27091.1 hypothetical protein BEP19_00525 [Ammoniphilus oxalaticus]